MFDLLRHIVLISLLLCAGQITLAQAAKLSDPMQPAPGYQNLSVDASSNAVTTDWVLQSVLLGSERAVAVIDGIPVARGESFRGAKLLRVKSDEVILQWQNGKKFILKLAPGVLKKMSVDRERGKK